jgi:hypothetical protein
MRALKIGGGTGKTYMLIITWKTSEVNKWWSKCGKILIKKILYTSLATFSQF